MRQVVVEDGGVSASFWRGVLYWDHERRSAVMAPPDAKQSERETKDLGVSERA